MKLYNPFKPHLVQVGEYYYVRRWRLIYWEGFDRSGDLFWWMTYQYQRKYCWVKDIDSAYKLLYLAKGINNPRVLAT